MNREILFRGKRKDNGEWVDGYYCGKYNKTFFSPAEDSAQIIDKDLYWHEVIPETVGQYTGLDANGKKIFEGDIVKHYNNSDDGFDIGAMYWDEQFSQWKRTSIGNFHHRSFTYTMSRSCEYEIIGNIHDNPELLEVHNGTENADSM